MKLKELKKAVNVSWSPADQYPLMLAAGSAAKQVDANFSSSSFLELYTLNLEDPSLDLTLKGGIPTQNKFQKLVWSGAGVIVGGCDGGELQFYNVDKLLNSASDSLIGSCSKHTGAVSALDINPYQKNLLASGASDSEIFIWDLNNTSQPMAPGNRHQPYEHVQGVAWNQQVQHILGSTFATNCLVWDLRKNEPIMKLSDSQSRTKWRALAWHPSVATQLCIASEDDQLPVVQLWDLRLAASPVVTMEGHRAGALSLSWCAQDPDLLLSTGKDGRLLVWNPNSTRPGGELVLELESSARFCGAAEWAPRGGLLAAAGGTVSVHALLGAGPPRESASAASNFLDSFGGAAELQALPAVAAPAPAPARPMPARAPRWLRRPVAARFAFGGKLVTFEKCPQESQKMVYISQVVTDPDVVERASELDHVLRLTSSREPHAAETLAEYCRQKGDETEDQNERYLWFILRASFLPTCRTEILNLLGFKQDEIPQKFKGPSNEAAAQTGLSRGESTETEAELSTDTSTDLSETQTQIERKLSNLDLETTVNDVLIPNGDDSTSLICRALVCGNVEEAVELCLDAKRTADALLIASLGSPELVCRVQRYYVRAAGGDPVALLAGGLLGGGSLGGQAGWEPLLRAAAPASWRSTLAALVTHADNADLGRYCEMLAARLRAAGESAAAALCCAVGASGGAAAGARGPVRAPLALLLRAAAQVRGLNHASDGGVRAVLEACAAELAAQGCLHSALAALADTPSPLRDRLQAALRHPQTQRAGAASAPGVRTRTVSGQSQRSQYGYNEAPYNNGPVDRSRGSISQPPRPPSVNSATGGITSRSKYKVDPSVQSAPYGQYGFPGQAGQAAGYGYNSPIPEQYGGVPAHNFAPISNNPMNPTHNPMNPMNPAPLNPMNPAPLNPMIPAPLNPINPAPLNPLNPMNPTPLNPMNPTPLNPMAPLNSQNSSVNGGYYNSPPAQPAPAKPAPKPAAPGWNDPPMMAPKAKEVGYEMSARHAGSREWGRVIHRRRADEPKQEVQQQAPITHPLFGVEPPQHVPLVPNQYPGQYPGQEYGQYPGQQYPGQQGPGQQYPGQQGPGQQYPGQQAPGQQQYPGQQYPGQQYPGQQQFPGQGQMPGQYQDQQYQANVQSYQPPVEPAAVAAPVEKPPLPEEYLPLQQTFDGLLERCQQHANPQMKRKLEDVQRRLEAMYDLLRENKLSEAGVSTLRAVAGAAAAGDGAGAAAAAGALAGGTDFAAAASFLPGLKVLLAASAQLC